jgi:trimeric autotransporter adhesin
MKTNFFFIRLFSAIAALFLLGSAEAGIPVWTFTPLTATTVSVLSNGTATIQYLVTNQSHKSHTLVMTSVTGISQTTTAGNCANPFALSYRQSCTLTLEVNGSALQGNVVGGPKVCQQGSAFECYQPSPSNRLNIEVTSTAPSTPLLAAGQYSDGSVTRPLLALGTDAGASWTFPTSITQPTTTPAFSSDGIFRETSCNGTTCIVVGQYKDSSGTSRPLLALRTDAGASWTFPASITQPTTTPAFSSNGNLSGASCNGLTCIAVGQYRDSSGTGRPLLALSTDAGASWTFPTSITQPTTTPAFSSNGNLSGASCNGSTCIAVGQYRDSSAITHPLLALSTDAGASWTFPTSITQPTTTPAFSNFGTFSGASCNGSTCIAVGSYHDAAVPRPLLAVSTDAGASWTFPSSITQPITTPAFNSLGGLSGASCNGTTCIAVGQYEDTSITTRPLLALSTDAGASWTFPTSITQTTTTPAFNSGGGLSGASCNGTTCIAAGRYEDSSFTTRPLLALSTDAGASWTFPTSITQPTTTPAFNDDGILNGASCNSSTCISLGQYRDSSGTGRPLLALSTDAGASWTFPTSITQPTTTPAFNSDGALFAGEVMG